MTEVLAGTHARSRRRDPGVLLGAGVTIIGLLFAAPFLYLLISVVRSGSVLDVLGSGAIGRPLLNSLILGASVSAAATVLGTFAAVLVQRADVRGRRVLRIALALPLVLPSYVGATALLAATGVGGMLPFIPRPVGFWGAFAVLTIFTYPYAYLPVLARLTMIPTSTEEAARVLGRSAWPTTWRVLLPQLRPAIAGGALLVFLYTLSDFGAVSLLRYDTLTRVIYSSRLLDRDLSLALGLILAVLALAIALLMRRAGVGAAPPLARTRWQPTITLGRWRSAVSAILLLPLLIGVVLPIVIFVYWVLRGGTTVGVGYSGWGDDLSFLVSPLLGSASAAITAGVVAVLVTLPVAYAVERRGGVLAELSGSVVTSVFALPGLVVALAIITWTLGTPGPIGSLYQTFPLLILAYVLHFGAQSLTGTRSAITAVPVRLEEAAESLGVPWRRRFLRVDLPLLLPGLLAAGGLVMLSTMKELPATLMLAPIGFETLATVIWGAAEDGFFAEVGITSILLIALSGVLTWFLVLRKEFHDTQT